MHKKAIYDLAIGKVLKELQDQRHIERNKIAEILEIGDLAVTRIENGAERMTAGELLLLINSLDLSWDDFLQRVATKFHEAKAELA